MSRSALSHWYVVRQSSPLRLLGYREALIIRRIALSDRLAREAEFGRIVGVLAVNLLVAVLRRILRSSGSPSPKIYFAGKSNVELGRLIPWMR